MPRAVIYKCCICGIIIKPEETYRLVKQRYHVKTNGGHHKVDQYDFCPRCYSKFHRWVNKIRKDDTNVN